MKKCNEGKSRFRHWIGPGILSSIIWFSLTGCHRSDPDQGMDRNIPGHPIEDRALHVVSGSRVYVPAYARVYHYTDHKTISLITTLAIHNTDPEQPLVLKSVRYYSENGTLLKDYLVQPRSLSPMATAIFHLHPEKQNAGIGANAVVEWVSEYRISNPIIETIMISTEGNRGVSFISPGYVVGEAK